LADIFTKEKRSWIMSGVKNKNTSIEIRVRKSLFSLGFRYKINDRSLPGSPDITLPKYKTAIFIHGCFWHGHSNCGKAIKPNSNIEFWHSKIQKNRLRDKKVNSVLRKLGWNILIVWDCELKNKKSFSSTIDRLSRALQDHYQIHFSEL
jgi:DNA mismatch endonuclease, patch repair protein